MKMMIIIMMMMKIKFFHKFANFQARKSRLCMVIDLKNRYRMASTVMMMMMMMIKIAITRTIF